MGPDVRPLIATGDGTSLYRVAPWVLVRTPLLPVSRLAWVRQPRQALAEPEVVRALAVGSPTLLDKALRAEPDAKEAARTDASLARYLIRMSTRPTPYGAFAAVSLAGWAEATDLCLSERRRTRTRPDLGWLRGLLADRERDPAVRSRLRWRAEPLAAESGDRLVAPAGGSVRATEPARLALAAAGDWIAHDELAERLRESSGGTAIQVAGLIDQLRAAGLLHSDLVPALTGEAATSGADGGKLVRYADDALAPPMTQLAEAMAAADEGSACAAERFAAVSSRARAMHEAGETFQTDLARDLRGAQLSAEVGRECAGAVEVLLRLGPGPAAAGDLAGYAKRFAARWGQGQELPLTEVFDPVRGLGPLPHTHGAASAIDPAVQARRADRLMTLALEALRDDRRSVRLDDRLLADLTGWPARATARALTPSIAPDAPLSLDVSAFLLATDRDAVDAGDFTLVIGPNLGASSAGRWLGRFADLFGTEGRDCYQWLTRAEQAADAAVPAEVVYLPAVARSANVVVRPTVGEVEIVVSGRGSASHQLDLTDLLVGHDGARLYLRSRSLGVRVRPTARHMLNHHQAPPVCQFLDAVGQGLAAEFSGFDWGQAESLPVLPRVSVGRTVLAPARWLVSVPGWTPSGGVDRAALDAALDSARTRWGLPARVYATVADNRLLLDLTEADDREQLRREFKTSGGAMRLQEALPDVGDAWLPGPDGRYLTELVISLVRRPGAGVEPMPVSPAGAASSEQAPTTGESGGVPRPAAAGVFSVTPLERVRLPGSDWLFAKFYAPYEQLTRLLTAELADLIDMAENSGLARRWFFLRYSDPEPHLRIRWQGEPDLLLRHLLPQVNDFAQQLLDAGRITRLVLDSYDRELERYGGPVGLELCEDAFCADSSAVRRLLSLPGHELTDLAVASTAALLAGLGLDRSRRVAFYEAQTALFEDPQIGRAAGADYRQRKARLRALLAGQHADAALSGVLDGLRAALAPTAAALTDAERTAALSGQLRDLLPSLVHMHHNRMVGPGQPSEPQLLHLLLRTERGLLLSG